MTTLLERALAAGAPLVDGEHVTFVWRGEVAPRLMSDLNGWQPEPAEAWDRVEPGVWARTLTLPRAAYVEYAYQGEGGRSLTDPLNPREVSNGMGGVNSYFYTTDGAPSPWKHRDEDGHMRGRLSRHIVHSEHLIVGRERTVYLYHPPSSAVSGPYPLVVVLDGPQYLRQAQLARIVDNLIAAGRIPPLALAMVENGEQARYVEYACNDATLAFLRQRVLPLAREHLDLLDLTTHPGAYGILGASMGGLFALYAGLRFPEVYGHVLSQSGAFALEALGTEPVVCDLARSGPQVPIRVWLDVGQFEFLLDANRRMRDILRERDYAVGYHEYAGGHNYTAWGDDVARGLEALFGGDGQSGTANEERHPVTYRAAR